MRIKHLLFPTLVALVVCTGADLQPARAQDVAPTPPEGYSLSLQSVSIDGETAPDLTGYRQVEYTFSASYTGGVTLLGTRRFDTTFSTEEYRRVAE